MTTSKTHKHYCPKCGGTNTVETVKYTRGGWVHYLYCGNDKCKNLLKTWIEKLEK